MRVKLPTRIILLLILVALLTIWQALRFATSIVWRDTLETYAPYPGPLYIGGMGALWTLIGLLILWSFWRGRGWTRKALLIAAGSYAAWIWLDRLFIQAGSRANYPFDLLVTIILLSFTAIVVLDPHSRIYFEREAYEREFKNPPSA
jgi:hypothetical protein